MCSPISPHFYHQTVINNNGYYHHFYAISLIGFFEIFSIRCLTFFFFFQKLEKMTKEFNLCQSCPSTVTSIFLISFTRRTKVVRQRELLAQAKNGDKQF